MSSWALAVTFLMVAHANKPPVQIPELDDSIAPHLRLTQHRTLNRAALAPGALLFSVRFNAG